MTDDNYDPGNFAEEGFEDTDGASVLANVTKLDLGVLGYNCVKIQSYRPAAYGSWSNIIAVRREVRDDIGDIICLDYHYIKFSPSDLAWLHKPGSSTIMKLINNPSNTEIWTNEGIRNGVYCAGTIKYGGSIYYILYKTNHGGTTRVWTGEHYHSGTQHYYLYANVCSDCGDYKMTYWVSEDCSGPPCSVPNRIIQPELER